METFISVKGVVPGLLRMALVFPGTEIERRKQLELLMQEWASAVSPQPFTLDGFYPYYWNQPIRVLAIGRESRGLENCDYIDCVLNDGYWISRIGSKRINGHILHRRLMYVVYGILKGFPAFRSLPTAAEIGFSVGKKDGISFAWMNISKISNESNDYRTNFNDLSRSYNASINGGRNFLAEEVLLLSPDVIISMNVGERLIAALKEAADITLLSNSSRWLKGVYYVSFKVAEKGNAILIDSYHFAAHSTRKLKGVNDKDSFYDPICTVVKDCYARCE